tara:strand:+ start:43 stop:1614 length:1572 start_codon:yes stop_codon:yes gene_type:complete
MLGLMQALTQNNELDNEEFLSPQMRPDGRYVTSEANLDKWIDPRIFRETQVKRFLRWLTTAPPLLRLFFNWLFITKAGMKLSYFEQQEDKNPDKQYALHEISAREENFTMHNLGHATQLIQISGMNILTDPVFNDLAPLIYPATTKGFGRNFQATDLPPIDVILISHNHRDHVDEQSLKALINKAQNEGKSLPQLLVPVGDEDFFTGLGFTDVKAFEWHEEITLKSQSQQPITFCSTPADHRSGRHGYDSHKSLVMGWTISPKNRDEILYFAGDTARISDVRMQALALDIYQLYQRKKMLGEGALPKLINMEPGGPNYTRKDMQPTHQSAVDSIVSSFRLAIALNAVSMAHRGETPELAADKWLDKTATVFMHHNKYELGPDRFNENVFIYTRLLSYLQMNDEQLQQHLEKQQEKSKKWSLFHRRKDFIIDGVYELRQLAAQIWPEEDDQTRNNKIVAFLKAKIHFPLINEKLSSEDCFKFQLGEQSTIMPDTFFTDKHSTRKRKGAKEAVVVVDIDADINLS